MSEALHEQESEADRWRRLATRSHASLSIEAGERCAITGLEFSRAHGALSKVDQTKDFIRERERLADMPAPGERCAQTGRLYENGSGCLTRTQQTRNFLAATIA